MAGAIRQHVRRAHVFKSHGPDPKEISTFNSQHAAQPETISKKLKELGSEARLTGNRNLKDVGEADGRLGCVMDETQSTARQGLTCASKDNLRGSERAAC